MQRTALCGPRERGRFCCWRRREKKSQETNANYIVTYKVFDCYVLGKDQPLRTVSILHAKLARRTGAQHGRSLDGGGNGVASVLALQYRAADEDYI